MELQEDFKKILKPFVSNQAAGEIYASLVKHGAQTISQLARTSGVERTRIYRSLNELQSLQLVEVELQPHRQIIHPASINNLQNVIAAKKAELEVISKDVELIDGVIKKGFSAGISTSVKFYRGQDGIEQMFWNQTKTTGPMVSILSENMQSHTSKAFFSRWVEKCNERGITSRSIIDNHFIELQKKWYGGEFSHSMKRWQARKMPDYISTIPHRTSIYDSVTNYFSWEDGDAFGIEIYNQDIADSQRQYFELLWEKSQPLN